MPDHNLNRLAGIIAEIVTALGIDVGDCNLGPGPDICALGDEAVATLKSRMGGTPSGRAEELITQLEAVAFAQGNLVDIFEDSTVSVIRREADDSYTLPLYLAPPASADAVSVPRESLEMALDILLSTLSDDEPLIEELRALLAQQEVKS